MELIICYDCEIVLENIVRCVNDEITILFGIWFHYVVWNIVNHTSRVSLSDSRTVCVFFFFC